MTFEVWWEKYGKPSRLDWWTARIVWLAAQEVMRRETPQA